MIRVILLLGAVFASPLAFGCKFPFPEYVVFDPSLARSTDLPPAAPVVTVEFISRGKMQDPPTSCDGIGLVVLSIPVTSETRDLVYSVDLVASEHENILFPAQPRIGLENKGMFRFLFPWLDKAAKKQNPLNLILRVTAFRRSGLMGGTTDVIITTPE